MRSLFHSATYVAASSSRAEGSRLRIRLRWALAGLLALNGILFFLLFRAPMGSPEDREAELQRLEEQHRAATEQVRQLRQLREKVQAATRNEQQFARENFLQRSSAFSKMIENLEELASSNQLRPSDISYRLNPEDNQLAWVNVEVTLSVEGEYSDLVRFVNELEQSDLFWIIQGLEVSGDPAAGLRLNLQTETYLLPS
jgi:Tfp pilus assembly protein PilO